MKLDGDIKVWTDDKRACARLTAEGPEGPIVVQASAPLAMVRKKVAQTLEARGHQVSGDHPGFEALVSGSARSLALHRLKQLAPALFVPGGVATFLALRELRRRRRARDAARRARDEAMKPIGPLEEDDDDLEDQYLDDDEVDDGDGEEITGWRRPRNRRTGARVGAAATDAALAVASASPQVRAGVTLLRLARRNPRARRKVATIVAKAQDGDPRARKQVRVLAKAKRIEAARGRPAAPRLPARSSPLALLARPPSAAHPAPGGPSRRRGVFWPWDAEMIRRRGA